MEKRTQFRASDMSLAHLREVTLIFCTLKRFSLPCCRMIARLNLNIIFEWRNEVATVRKRTCLYAKPAVGIEMS